MQVEEGYGFHRPYFIARYDSSGCLMAQSIRVGAEAEAEGGLISIRAGW